MSKKHDNVLYALKQGNKIVYFGTTNNRERREQEHKDNGKKFSKMEILSRRMTEEGAKRKEAEKIKAYKKNNRGKKPKYNKDSDG